MAPVAKSISRIAERIFGNQQFFVPPHGTASTPGKAPLSFPIRPAIRVFAPAAVAQQAEDFARRHPPSWKYRQKSAARVARTFTLVGMKPCG